MTDHRMPQAAQGHFEGDLRAPEGSRFAILASRWNPRITDALVDGARRAFADHGVADDAVDVLRVPGAWELPVLAARDAEAGRLAASIELGCVVRGETRHYEHVADRCAEGLMRVSLDHRVPVCNGVLAVDQHEDAAKRAGGSHGNKGEEAALVAIEMAQLLERLP
jgi:6,7-dimethyl-8-ribityllumazine synthase